MLSRLYLYKADYSQAATYAGLVANSPNYVLATDYSFYDGETAEDVFSISMTAIDNSRTGSGGWASYYNPAELGGRGDCPFAQSFIDSFEPGDKRLSDLSALNPGNMLTYTTKFPDAVNNADNAPVQRVTEIYLNLAEASAQVATGIDSDALDIVNMLRDRAGLTPFMASDFADKAAFISTILDERRKELCFEGHHRLDLLRNGLQLDPTNSATAPGGEKVIMPIPQREIDLGSSLPQNAGY